MERSRRAAVQEPRGPARDGGRRASAALLARRDPAALERAPRPDEPRRPEAAAAARLPAPRGLAPQALPRAPGRDRPLADLGPLEPRLRRPRPARLLLPRELVDLAGHLDPRQDDPGRLPRHRRVLTVSAVIVAFHSGAALGRCLASVAVEEVIVVDNGGDAEV